MTLPSDSDEPVIPVLSKSLWKVTWPLLIGLFLSFSLNFVDAFFLARISDHAVAGVGALFPLLGASLVVFAAVGQAGASIASQFLGAKRYAEAKAIYLVLIAFNLAIGLVTSLGFFLLHDVLPGWLGLDGQVRSDAASFLGIVGGFQFLKSTQMAYGNILMSRGETRWLLLEALLTNACNVALNLAFASGWFGLPDLGVRGVALATVVALAFGLGFTMLVVHVRLALRLPLEFRGGLLVARMKRVLSVGLPSALEPIAYQSTQMMLNALIVTWGATSLAARTYVSNFVMVTTILWGAAFGIGTQIVIAHRIGAEDFEGANREMRRAVGFAVLGNVVLAALLALFQRPLLGTLTDDPQIIELCTPLFFLLLLVEPARAVNIVAGGALRSAGDARYTALVGMSMMWSIGLPICYFLGRRWGLPGVWLGMAIDELSRGIVNHRRWQTGRWKDFRVTVRPAIS